MTTKPTLSTIARPLNDIHIVYDMDKLRTYILSIHVRSNGLHNMYAIMLRGSRGPDPLKRYLQVLTI